MRIAVITGGATAERAVAFAGAAQIVEALRSRGHTVRAVDTVTGLLSPTDEQRLLTTAVGREPPAVAELDERERAMLSNGLAGLKEVTGADVLFLCLHAGRGEGGILQAVLDVIGVPYTGSGALSSALAMDKDLAKRLFRAAGVPVPAWFMAPVASEDVTTELGWPVIVKPSKMGSSVGMTLVRNAEGLDAAVRAARAYDAEVMAEQFIPRRELTGRSGEGRVGEEGRSRWAPDHLKKKKEREVVGGLVEKKMFIHKVSHGGGTGLCYGVCSKSRYVSRPGHACRRHRAEVVGGCSVLSK